MVFNFDEIPKTVLSNEIADTPEKLKPYKNKTGFIIGDTFYECKSGYHEDLEDYLWDNLPHGLFNCYLRITAAYDRDTHCLGKIYIGIRKEDKQATLSNDQAITIRNLLACYDKDYLHSVDSSGQYFLDIFDFGKSADMGLGCSNIADREAIINTLPQSEVENFSKYPPRAF